MQKRTYRRIKYFMETQQLSQLEVFQGVLGTGRESMRSTNTVNETHHENILLQH